MLDSSGPAPDLPSYKMVNEPSRTVLPSVYHTSLHSHLGSNNSFDQMASGHNHNNNNTPSQVNSNHINNNHSSIPSSPTQPFAYNHVSSSSELMPITRPVRKIVGVLLVSDMLPPSPKSSLGGFVLGSILMENEGPISVLEVRRAITIQVSPCPTAFSFLSRDGWPLSSTQESRLFSPSIIDDENVIKIRHTFDLSLNLKSFRMTVVNLLTEAADSTSSATFPTSPSSRSPPTFDFKFVDSNGWPVQPSQESSLMVTSVITNQSVRIKLKHPLIPAPLAITSSTSASVFTPTSIPPAISFPSITDTRDFERQLAIPNYEKVKRLSKKKPDDYMVMLSYSRQEAAQHALDLKAELIKEKISVYLDVHEIKTGSDWMDSLNHAVKSCRIFVPLITPTYGCTQWTNREVKLADILKKEILPINFLTHWPPDCLAIQFATTQYVPWIDEADNFKESDLDGIKVWPKSSAKRIAKILANMTPHNKLKNKLHFKDEIPTTIKMPALNNGNLVVISAHPKEIEIMDRIRKRLESEGHKVWTSCEHGSQNNPDETPCSEYGSFLPTINESFGPLKSKDSSDFSDEYLQFSSKLVDTKNRSTQAHQRPTSLNIAPACSSIDSTRGWSVKGGRPSDIPDSFSGKPINSMMESSIMPFKGRGEGKRPLRRMMSNVGAFSRAQCSLSPYKQNKLMEFRNKVNECGVVIVILSDAYSKSRTSKSQAYYCEQRKRVIMVRTNQKNPDPLFSNMIKMFEVHESDELYLEKIKDNVKTILNPQSVSPPATTCLVDVTTDVCMKFLRPEQLGNCVYVIGSHKDLNPRSIEICKALGVVLARVNNLILVTCGFKGVQELVAKSFLATMMEMAERKGDTSPQFEERLINILDEKDENNEDNFLARTTNGDERPIPHGSSLLLHKQLEKREKVLPLFLDTCILIEGEAEGANEVLQFVWKDQFVLPVRSTGKAASEENKDFYKIPSKVFDRHSSVKEELWQILGDVDSSPVQVATAIGEIVVDFKTHIKSVRKNAEKAHKLSSGSFKGLKGLRRASRRKTRSDFLSSRESTPVRDMRSDSTGTSPFSDGDVLESDCTDGPRKKESIPPVGWRKLGNLLKFRSRMK